MTLERLTQITSVGITSGITLSGATLTGVTTLTTASASGNISAVDGTFSGNLNVAGTLTYEDVTNIDSVGIITAQSGLHVTGGSVGIGTDAPAEDVHIQKSRADVLIEGTNDTVSGNVANLALMAPFYRKVGYSIKDSDGNEDFFIGRPYGQGDANPDLVINMTGTEKVRIRNDGRVGIGTDVPERTLSVAANNPMIQIWGTGGSGKQWSIISSDDTTGAAAASRGGNFVIYDDTSGGLGDVLTLTGVGGSMGLGVQNPGAKLHVSGGNIKVDDGYGIDFSATGNGSGTMSSELLDDYEEGTFTPTIVAGADDGAGGDPPFNRLSGRYIKIGRKVHVDIYMRFTTNAASDGAHARIGGLPYILSNDSYGDESPSQYTRGGGTSTFHNTTTDITTCYGSASNANFYLYKDGGTNFILGGANNANLSGLYWIGFFEYITD